MSEDYSSIDRIVSFLEAAGEVRETLRAIAMWRRLAMGDTALSIVAVKNGWRYTILDRQGDSFSGVKETFHEAINEAAHLVSGD